MVLNQENWGGSLRQLIRYGVVGLLSNLLGYLVYLLITWLGVDPKLTVTLFYPLAATIAYSGHAQYSFAYKGGHASGFSRYVVAHVFGYLLNIASLYFFVDVLLYPHQLVQLCNIFLVAGFLFVAFKYFAFQSGKEEARL
ncbi:GtrA family protein [Deltaproteobacteria bacterium IMCC39524]|nr:GtrA family protein [Deltaproteobacteria bacterium IMCC39524]